MTINMSSPDPDLILTCQFKACTMEDLDLIVSPALKLLEDFQRDQPMDLSMLKTALLSKTRDELPEYTKLVKDGRDLGWYHLIHLVDALELDDVNILSPYRSQGLGSLIVDRVKQEARRLNLPVIATVQALNPKAIRFYQRHGFKSTDTPDASFLNFIFDSGTNRPLPSVSRPKTGENE